MATYTSNYGWTKPSGSDNVDISVLNDNLDDQDSTIHDAFLNMAPPFSESSTYAVDDIVLYGTGLYKCHTAVVTPGSWTGSTNWQVYKLSEGGSGGGGTSNYNQLTNKPQINSVELSGNKTSAQLGLMASDGVVANPTGQTTGTLTALEVGGTKYAVPSGGTSDYTALTNKPSINGVELSGNQTASQLGMANSNIFQGTIAEWNALTTAEKKAYDHASIPDSLDGNVTFPASKVIMLDGASVEADLASAVPRTATGTTGSQLAVALTALTAEQRARCSIAINGNDIILHQGQAVSQFGSFAVTSAGVKEYRFNTNASKFYEFTWSSSLVSQEIAVTSWTLYYQGTPIS